MRTYFFLGKNENLNKCNKRGHRWEGDKCKTDDHECVIGFSWLRTGFSGGLSER